MKRLFNTLQIFWEYPFKDYMTVIAISIVMVGLADGSLAGFIFIGASFLVWIGLFSKIIMREFYAEGKKK